MKRLILSSIVAISLLGANAYAEATKVTSKSVSKSAVANAKSSANKQKSDVKVVKEAVESIVLVAETIKHIDENKKDEAIKSLEKAIGKIEVVLSNPKVPELIPVDAKVVVNEFLGNSRAAENAIITSIALLTNKRVQEGRKIASSLVDEIDFSTVNIPLISYPSSLKLAAKYLHDNKLKEAKAVLTTTLNTFVTVTQITPIGILKAQELITAASKVAKDNKELALAHLALAKESLKKDEVLGYVSTSETTYKVLNDEISKVEKEVRGKNKAEKLFEELIKKIKEFKEKALSSVKK